MSEPAPSLVSEARQRWLLSRLARLHEAGAEPVSGLVLPTGEFFPDRFDHTREAVERLLARVLKLAGLSDVPVELAVIRPEADDDALGGCSSGGCAPKAPARARLRRVEQTGDGYRVALIPQEAANPTVLTTVLVRAASHVFLREADAFAAFEPKEGELAVDLCGVALGFGVLLANGSYIYAKGCGGVNVSSATHLPVEEIALALAIHVVLHDAPARAAKKHLETTPRAHFAEAMAWAASNAGVVDLVRSDAAAIEAGSYSISEGRGWLSRVLGVGRAKGASAPSAAELEKLASQLKVRQSPADESRARRMAALAKLVEEEL